MNDPVGPIAPTRPRRDGRARTSARAALSLLVVVGLAWGGTLAVRSVRQEHPRRALTWFAPYVDVTLTPQYAFEDPEVNPGDTAVLGFVVAAATGASAADGAAQAQGCTPSWGGFYGLEQAATGVDLDRRIAHYRDHGGDAVVSFGGAANQELALTCHDDAALAAAYRAVVDRYDATTIDFDVEGVALDDHESVLRRARAIATIQQEAQATGRHLAVWLTLPVAPTGMLDNAIAVVDATLAAGVDLGGVNLMTMDYGGSRPDSVSMGDAVLQSLTASHRQLADAYRRAGLPLDSTRVWGKLGATPMIGVNDELTDVFGPADADALVVFARDRGLGRISMWSANRDAPCPQGPDATSVSNTCSGLAQAPVDFARILNGASGLALAPDAPTTTADPGSPTPPTTVVAPVDDPATSPYQVWDARQAYQLGDRVVRGGQVYIARWFTQGDDPSAPVANVHDSPWRMVGPVLVTDTPMTTTTLPSGTYPDWDPTIAYRGGDRVLRDGVGYQAHWFAQGIDPTAPPTGDGPSPWQPIVTG